MRLMKLLGTQGRGAIAAFLTGLLVACGSGGGDSAVGGAATPTITAEPASVEVLEGDAATFTVGADGTDPIAYQ